MGLETTIHIQKEPRLVTPFNAQDIGMREEQQDYFAFSDIYNRQERNAIGCVSVLADGMGGMENGAMASHAAVDTFMEVYRLEAMRNDDTTGCLTAAAYAANEAVKEFEGAGSTLCAAVIKRWRLYWISIGDSRIYFYRNGTLRQLNEEHNYKAVLEKMVRAGEISQEEAQNDPDREALTSYVGIDELSEIAVSEGEFPIYCGDSLLLCSDGLYRALSNEEIADILKHAGESVCDDLVRAALGKGNPYQDNITVTLMDID